MQSRLKLKINKNRSASVCCTATVYLGKHAEFRQDDVLPQLPERPRNPLAMRDLQPKLRD